MNEVICHGIPDRRPLKDGDIVNIGKSIVLSAKSRTDVFSRRHLLLRRSVSDVVDLSAHYFADSLSLGFHGDLNATYAVGEIDDESKKLIRTTRECLDEAIKMCRPGALFRDIGKVMSVLLQRLLIARITNFYVTGL